MLDILCCTTVMTCAISLCCRLLCIGTDSGVSVQNTRVVASSSQICLAAWQCRDQDFQELPRAAKQAKQLIKLRIQDPKTSQDLPRQSVLPIIWVRKSLTLKCGGTRTTTNPRRPRQSTHCLRIFTHRHSPCSMVMADGARQGVNGASVENKEWVRGGRLT